MHREPTIKGRKLGFKSTIWNIRKNKHLTRIGRRNKNSKNEDGIRSPWDISTCANIQVIGLPEEEEQNIENLFEK